MSTSSTYLESILRVSLSLTHQYKEVWDLPTSFKHPHFRHHHIDPSISQMLLTLPHHQFHKRQSEDITFQTVNFSPLVLCRKILLTVSSDRWSNTQEPSLLVSRTLFMMWPQSASLTHISPTQPLHLKLTSSCLTLPSSRQSVWESLLLESHQPGKQLF